jgi:hypothetical protein
MNKIDRDNLVHELSQPVCYPGGIVYEHFTGEQVPKFTPENFGKMYTELCQLKAVLIGMLEAMDVPE